jgi:hypothetical protein
MLNFFDPKPIQQDKRYSLTREELVSLLVEYYNLGSESLNLHQQILPDSNISNISNISKEGKLRGNVG